MIEVNILNEQVNDKAKESVEISEREFWRHYFIMLNIRYKNALSKKEIEVLSLVMSKELGISYFSKSRYNELQEDGLKLSFSEVIRLKERYIELGLVESSIHKEDKRKRVILPVEDLLSLQKYIKKNKKISFIFAYEIK